MEGFNLEMRRRLGDALKKLSSWTIHNSHLKDNLISEQELARVRVDPDWCCEICGDDYKEGYIANCCGVCTHEECIMKNDGCVVCSRECNYWTFNVLDPIEEIIDTYKKYAKELLFIGFEFKKEEHVIPIYRKVDFYNMTHGVVTYRNDRKNLDSILALCPLTWKLECKINYQNCYCCPIYQWKHTCRPWKNPRSLQEAKTLNYWL